MKTVISSAAIFLALVVLHGPSQAQQAAYFSQTGYASPAGYPSPMAHPPQMTFMPMQADAQALAAASAAPCESGNCPQAVGACGDCCCNPCCCQPKLEFFGEYLYLRARDAEVAYAVPANGPIVDPEDPVIQIGPTALVDFDYDSAYRAGFSLGMGDCSRIGARYTYFDTDTSHYAEILPPDEMHSLVLHPGTHNAALQFTEASAEYALDFDLVDVDFTRIISCGRQHEISLVMGGRYAGMGQDFEAQFIAATNDETVTTDIQFDGGGIRVGLDTEFYSCNRTCFVYATSAASFVAGEFTATYAQDDFQGGRLVYTDWQAGRLVTMLDLEIGLGWSSPQGCCRVSGGYMVSGWLNTVNTDDWIKAVQSDNFVGPNDKMTFDGLVARAELRF